MEEKNSKEGLEKLDLSGAYKMESTEKVGYYVKAPWCGECIACRFFILIPVAEVKKEVE